LDEAGNPRRKSARGRQRPAATVRSKKAPPRRRPAPVKTPAAVGAPEEVAGDEDDLDVEALPELAASGGTGEKAPVPARRPSGGGARRRTKAGD
ncbi:MAG: hypothetical protein ACYDAE_13460, partial [Steroidobacteraceae bacterium]